jgi:hypothetical protein
MGMLDFLGSLFRRKRAAPGPSDALGLFSAILGENWSRLSGRDGTAKAFESGLDRCASALSAEPRFVVVKARTGEQRPAAWLFYGAQAASRLAKAYIDARRSAGAGRAGASVEAEGAGLDLAVAGALADRLGEAIALAGAAAAKGSALAAGEAAAPAPSLSCEIAYKEDLAFIRWALLDYGVLEYRLDAGTAFLALAPEAAASIAAALEDPSSAYAAGLFALAPDREGRPVPGADADEERRLDGPRSFPLARSLAERRIVVPGGEARLSPAEVLVCATPRSLSSRSAGGYRIGLRLSGAGAEEGAALRCLASPLGPYEAGSQEWRALVGSLAARSSASLGALLGMEAKAVSAGPSTPEEAVSGGPAVAISYNVSFGGARGRALLVLDMALLGLVLSRLAAGGPPERPALASRSASLALEAIDSCLRRRAFPSYMRSLREVPPRASALAARLPVGGRPLYGIIEEMDARDAAAAIGKLVQKGFLLMEHRYAFFFHEMSAEDPAARAIATPCEDFEALFSRFPKRWDESDGARSRLRAAFGDFDSLVEAHYEAAWTLYRELLADRLALSARGEAVLRASGEAFSARLSEAIEEQGGAIAAAVASMDADARRSLPWADKARELCFSPEAASALAATLGTKALDALRDAAARVEARLREGREDALALWKDRGEFLGELASGGKGRGARRDRDA